MPRGSTTTKRLRSTATQTDTKNCNRIATPIKRTHRQKYNALANGYVKLPHNILSSPSPPPTPQSTIDRYGQYLASNHSTIELDMRPDFERTDSASHSDSSSEFYQNAFEFPIHESHRQIDVNSTKNLALHRDLGHLSFAITILRSCPLNDTLAILIVLLQIPPTFLSMIHLLFATLTYVPSTSVATSGLTYIDIFKGEISAPTLTTVLLLDFAVLLIWLFLWTPIQDVILDLAQAFIALTLGGGTYRKESGLKNIFFCFGVIGASHFFGNRDQKNHTFQTFLSSNISSISHPDDSLKPVIPNTGKRFKLLRVFLAIHILTQGVFRYIRDGYMRNKIWCINETSKDSDTEKIKVNPTNDHICSKAIEIESLTSLDNVKANLSSKNRKNDCAQVRISQPLWAALASTKIVMAKEYETSHAAAESAGANTTCMNNLGSAPFSCEANKIWITHIGADEILFSTSFFRLDENNDKGVVLDNQNIDKSKPFFIRVNKINWKAIKINATCCPIQNSDSTTSWTIEIFGLTPMSYYDFDFISTLDKSLIFSTNVRTVQWPTTESGTSVIAKPGTFPESPFSTLKNSVVQAVKKLEEERQYQKNSRKELRAKMNTARREFERLLANIASTGGNDDKMRQKIQQSKLHMRQAEEAAAILSTQIENIDSIPTDEISLYSEYKNEIQSQREEHKKVCSEISSHKHNAEREIQALNSDLASLQQKSETRKQRLSILNTKYQSILDVNAKGLQAQLKESEREMKLKERASVQEFYNERLQSINSQIYEGQAAHNAVVAAIEALLQVQQDMHQGNSPTLSSQNTSGIHGDPVPANKVTKTTNYPWATPLSSPIAFSGPSLSPFTSTASIPFKIGQKTRGRSSSMLSNISKFTQSSDGGTTLGYVGKNLLSKKDTMEDSKSSSKSANGSVNGAGSVGDFRIPVTIDSKVTSKIK